MASPGPTRSAEEAPPAKPNDGGSGRRSPTPPGIAARLEGRLVQWTALLRADLAALARSWVLRLWVLALALTTFVMLIGGVQGQGGVPAPASTLLAGYLATYLVVWSTVIIVLSAGSVSLEADIIADSILCRACTRTQYLTAKLVSRGLAVLGIFTLFSGAAGYVAWRYASNDTSFAAIATGIAIVGLALLLLVTLGVAFSVLFNNTLIAVIGLLLLWYVAGTLFSAAGAAYLSPASLIGNLPRLLRDSTAPQVVQCRATPTSLTLLFSKEVEPNSAEQIENYLVWCPPKGRRVPTTAVYDPTEMRVVLGGLRLPPGKTVKVSVSGVVDSAGNEISPAAATARATVTGATPETGGAEGDDPPVAPRAEEEYPAAEPDTAGNARRPPAERERRGEDRPLRVAQCVASPSSLKVTFSRPVEARDAERPRNYVIESPPGKTVTARAASYDPETRTVLLSGLSLPADGPVKVTVRNVRDTEGRRIARRDSSATYAAVTPWKYVLGFGLPALLAAFLAVAAFSRRDL
ncbi:MAG: hypothetical protein GX774_14390 [Armatimonadetes bacterium]|jgi:hypothetical protein|nr:hypothetical protein [Armatimonadota bacterium]